MGLAAIREQRRQDMVQRLRQEVAALDLPETVTVAVIGSWARGDWAGDSDIDLLVIGPEQEIQRARFQLMEIADDVIALDRDRWNRRRAAGDPWVSGLEEEALALVPCRKTTGNAALR